MPASVMARTLTAGLPTPAALSTLSAPVSVFQLVLASLAMGIGACVQGAVGFGSNLLAAPVLVLIDTDFVPGPVALASLLLNLAVWWREPADHDRRVRLALGGLVPGTLAAGALLTVLPDRQLSLLFAALVLVAVGLTATGLRVRPEPATLVGAGLASGFMGTISGIGGPPIALVYQRAAGPVLRATLARYFLLGGLVTVLTLAVVGRLGGRELLMAGALLPGTALGFACSGRLARSLDRRTARPAVLALSTLAAVAVIVRELG